MQQTILQQITALDGVLGCSLYSNTGQIRAAACPLIIDQQQLGQAAAAIIGCLQALKMADDLSSMELRFVEGRLIVRPLSDGFISVLCSRTADMSLLSITLNLALRKLEQTLTEGATQAEAVAATTGETSVSLRIRHLKQGDIGASFDQLGMVAVSQPTARQLRESFGAQMKKVCVTTETGESGLFPLMVINDVEMQYDGALVIGPGIERKLKASEGTKVVLRPA